MSALERVVIHVSHVRLELECPAASARALGKVFAPASRPVVPTRRTTRWVGAPTREGWSIEIDGHVVKTGTHHESLTTAIEFELVSRLVEWHPDTCALHAALVEIGGVWTVFVGVSGAGKSSLTLEAVRRGGRYFSDEIVVTDGHLVWGVGRAPVFDVGPVDSALPERLADADRDTYQFLQKGVLVARPIIPVPEAQWAQAPVDAGSIAVVRILGRGADEVTRTNGPHGLATLLQASCTPGWRELGPLAADRRSFALTWETPAGAIDTLMNATSHLNNGGAIPPR